MFLSIPYLFYKDNYLSYFVLVKKSIIIVLSYPLFQILYDLFKPDL